MLSLHPDPGKLRAAHNLFPRADGSLRTRPGAVQIIAGRIGEVATWGNRLLATKGGRIVLWTKGGEVDIASAGYTLQAVPYQAVAGDGQREDRLYVADGVRPLWYVHKTDSGYAKVDVVNSVTDGDGVPYPLPVPFCVAVWRNRLWIGDGSHRIYHCQNDRPEAWDPLWELQFQGAGPDAVRVLRLLGDVLAVGLEKSWWRVEGTSQYNWVRSEWVRGRGVCGIDAAAGLGARLWYADTAGLWELGGEQPLSEDIREAFASAPAGVQVVADAQRRLLLLNVSGRLYAMHIDAPGRFTEIWGVHGFGVFGGEGMAGWYGTGGVWLLAQPDAPDEAMEGTPSPVRTRYDTWDIRPNNAGSGRALLNRVRLTVAGTPGRTAVYYCESDEGAYSDEFGLSPLAGNLPGLPIAADYWPYRPVRRELVPRLPGSTFRHTLVAEVAIEIGGFDPEYRFGKAEE